MMALIFVLGIANAAYCGEAAMTAANNAKLEASLDADEIAALNYRTAQSTDLADIHSGESLVEESPYIILIGTLAVVAILLAFGGSW